jgi:hypothetical protein
MIAKLAIITLGALVLMFNGADAQDRTGTFGICRVHSSKPMGMRGVKRRNTNHRAAFTNRIHKGISRIQIWIENFM